MKKIAEVGLLVFLILFVLGVSFMMDSIITESQSFKRYCTEEYAGTVENGYCIYILNGNSVSFPKDVDWVRNNTDVFGNLKDYPKTKDSKTGGKE